MALNGDLEIGTARFLVFSGKQNERLSIGGKWAVSFAEQNVYSWNARRPVYNLIFWPRRSRSATACCDQTERSVGPCVRTCIGLSSALWKNGASDPDAFWHHRSDGSRDEAGSGVWESVHGKGYFWGRIWGAPL